MKAALRAGGVKAALRALALLAAGPAWAAGPDKPVRIGVVTDMTGSLSAQSGPGSVTAAQLAVQGVTAESACPALWAA